MRGGERERESERGRRVGGEGWEGRMKGERGKEWGGMGEGIEKEGEGFNKLL